MGAEPDCRLPNPSSVTFPKLLLKAGANLDAKTGAGGTPLMKAAWFGCELAARRLLDAGADSSVADSQGLTARDLAATKGHEDLVKLL